MIGIIMFLVALALLLSGFPVAFTFGAVAVIFGLIVIGPSLFANLPYQIMSIMQNEVLIAIPLFILMGLILQRTKLAEQLLETMGQLCGRVEGGLAYATILVGTLLAATTGIVGASVIAMGVISLPVMMRHGYDKALASGIICASGTLGQIIPPSIVLIILGDVMNLPVGDLFKAAVLPGLTLVISYVLFIAGYTAIKKGSAPPLKKELTVQTGSITPLKAIKAIIPPIALIIAVLGSIFSGIATPTESSSIGVVGALLLAALYRRLNIELLNESLLETVKITAMIFAILIGATAFSLVFNHTGGYDQLEQVMSHLPGGKWGFLLTAMLCITVLGFFIDFVEICFILVPMLYPIAEALGLNLVWFAVLIALNLQTSFLTPPFGFSLFYLRGVAPKTIKTQTIYKGVIPFIVIQLIILIIVMCFPEVFGLSMKAE